MENNNFLEPIKLQAKVAVDELLDSNTISAQFGLTLSDSQIQELVQSRFSALRENGRIEFGEGVLKKLVIAFCDSPYISRQNYAHTLLELQDSFYYFKNESMDLISDDELIDYMKSVFDGRAQGSTEYLSGTSLEELCRHAREGFDPFDADTAGDQF